MATLNTSMLSLPGTSLGVVRDAAMDAGLIGKLSTEQPTIFGPVHGATFTGTPRAEIVGESQPKSASEVALTPFRAEPIKLHVGVRTSDEFLWADEDYRLGIIRDFVAPSLGTAIGRAVDLFAFHGINPKTGSVSDKATKYLAQTAKSVVAGDAPTAELIEAVGLVGGNASGVAFNPDFLFSMATQINPVTGTELNPGMGFGTDLGGWRGLAAAKSTTVSGMPELGTDSGIKAIVGDWSQVRWGFQRNFPLELIKYGDPDNTFRDLKGHNEVFLRAEAVIYVAIGDLGKFSLVKAPGAGA